MIDKKKTPRPTTSGELLVAANYLKTTFAAASGS